MFISNVKKLTNGFRKSNEILKLINYDIKLKYRHKFFLKY